MMVTSDSSFWQHPGVTFWGFICVSLMTTSTASGYLFIKILRHKWTNSHVYLFLYKLAVLDLLQAFALWTSARFAYMESSASAYPDCSQTQFIHNFHVILCFVVVISIFCGKYLFKRIFYSFIFNVYTVSAVCIFVPSFYCLNITALRFGLFARNCTVYSYATLRRAEDAAYFSLYISAVFIYFCMCLSIINTEDKSKDEFKRLQQNKLHLSNGETSSPLGQNLENQQRLHSIFSNIQHLQTKNIGNKNLKSTAAGVSIVESNVVLKHCKQGELYSRKTMVLSVTVVYVIMIAHLMFILNGTHLILLKNHGFDDYHKLILTAIISQLLILRSLILSLLWDTNKC